MRLFASSRIVWLAIAAAVVLVSVPKLGFAAPPRASARLATTTPPKAAPRAKVEQTRAGWRMTLANGSVLFEGWNPVASSTASLLAPASITITPAKDGATISYRFFNESSQPMRAMDLELPVLEISSSPSFMDATYLGTVDAIPPTQTGWMGGVYPRDLYSPVSAMTWRDGSVGISLIYPILEYRHDAAVVVSKAGPGKWKPMIGLNNRQIGGQWWTALKYEATIPSGAERIYRVEIRASTPQAWLDTLEPYREYFRQTYGQVKYARDARSIAAVQIAMEDQQSVSNPDGWIGPAGRPDLHGYAAVGSMMREALLKADRTILWSPTGLHRTSIDRNYPFKFVSRWFEPQSTSALRNAPSVLATLPSSSTKSWGLWWGHAADVQEKWDSAEYRPLSLGDERASKLAKRELDLAISTGARIIGLDAFSHHSSPYWELRPWLAQMVSEKRGVTFCTEGRNPDIMHVLAPTWVDAFGTNKRQSTNGSLIESRFVLADWLLPGHETWAGVMWNRADRADLRTEPGSAARRGEIDRLRRLGFVPVLFGD